MMQTFLPYPDFARCAATLDYRRLGKQRVECRQILTALTVPGAGWVNHPATRMWRGCERALENYAMKMVSEWVSRGYKNTMVFAPTPDAPLPSWMGDERLHSSHRAALLVKDPAWYGQFGWLEKPVIDYWWPM